MSNLVGKTLGKYEITEEIGHGGVATVYQAWDVTHQRRVALKVLPAYSSTTQFPQALPPCCPGGSEVGSPQCHQEL